MEGLLRALEYLFSAIVIFLASSLGALLMIGVVLVVGYLVWNHKHPRLSVAEECKKDSADGIGNGIATKIRSVPLYLGIIGWLEVDELEEYVLLDRDDGGWEEIRGNKLLIRNPFAPPYRFRRVWKHPEPLEIEASGATRGRHQWDIRVTVSVRYSVKDPTVAAVAHVEKGLKEVLTGTLVRIVNNYSEDELLTPDNWRAALEDEVLADFKKIGAGLGIQIEEVMKVEINVDQKLIDTIRVPLEPV